LCSLFIFKGGDRQKFSDEGVALLKELLIGGKEAVILRIKKDK